jgi:hypothetical protein
MSSRPWQVGDAPVVVVLPEVSVLVKRDVYDGLSWGRRFYSGGDSMVEALAEGAVQGRSFYGVQVPHRKLASEGSPEAVGRLGVCFVSHGFLPGAREWRVSRGPG